MPLFLIFHRKIFVILNMLIFCFYSYWNFVSFVIKFTFLLCHRLHVLTDVLKLFTCFFFLNVDACFELCFFLNVFSRSQCPIDNLLR